MRFNFDATGIGSVPFKDPEKACRVIRDNFPTIPFWPQLPRRSFLENMYVQYSEGVPGVVIDEREKTIHVDTEKAVSEMETVYAKYLEQDTDFFGISESRAEGLYRFLGSMRAPHGKESFVKGHITGPVSFGLTVTDQKKRSIIYDRDIFEAVTKVLAMKARWQIGVLRSVFPNVIIFIDEPYLVSIGSSYVTIDIQTAMQSIDEVIASIKGAGALCGIHCCGNTDWPLLLKRDVDILNFDAYNFSREFSLYATEISGFLGRGGTIAWGIVPSSEAVMKETEADLASKFGKIIDSLAERGVARESLSNLVTPSCGVGSLDETIAEKAFATTKALSERMKEGK